MARRRAPGTDGLPMEFYVRFWEVFGQDLVDVLNACYAFASLSLSQHHGVTSLVFKRGDRLDARGLQACVLGVGWLTSEGHPLGV